MLFRSTANGQPEGASLHVSSSVGRIYKHSPNFLPTVRGTSVIVDVNAEWQTNGARAWHSAHHYPIVGVALSLADFGDPQVFGNAIAVLPNLSFTNHAAKHRFYSFLRVGFGVAYITQAYNPVTNPENNVIGRNFNNITDMRGGVGFYLNPHSELTVGASFTHYSSGASMLPNLGINVPAANVGFRYTPQPITSFQRIESEKDQKIHVLAYFAVAPTTLIGYSGPQYAAYIGDVRVEKKIGVRDHISVGLSAEHQGAVYAFLRHTYPEIGEAAANAQARRYAVTIGDEWRFGQFGFSLQAGFYLTDPFLRQWFAYEKLGWSYYLLPKQHAQPYLNIQLKAHKIVAEYFSFGAGIKF